MVAIAIKLLSKRNPGLRLIVSYADESQGHYGGIYQAGNWIYVGSKEYHCYRVNGEHVHPRTLYSRYGVGGQSIGWLHEHVDDEAVRVKNGKKHKYVYVLDQSIRDRIQLLKKPHPNRAGSADSGTHDDQS